MPTGSACHNTTANHSYKGAQAYQQAYYSVPMAKAKAMGVPLFLGEFGVQNSEPGRHAYITQMQKMMDANLLDGTVWLLANTGGASNSLNLLDNGKLNDMGAAWQAWFKATNFRSGSGAGSRANG